MSEVKPVKITTPVKKHVILLKPIVTGYDQEQIDNEYYKTDESLSPTSRANRKAIETLVLSVDGSSDEVVDAVLSMHLNDYRAVVAACNALTEPMPAKKK